MACFTFSTHLAQSAKEEKEAQEVALLSAIITSKHANTDEKRNSNFSCDKINRKLKSANTVGSCFGLGTFSAGGAKKKKEEGQPAQLAVERESNE